MPDDALTVEEVLAIMREGAAPITALTAGLTVAELNTPLPDGNWAPNGVLAHLRSASEALGASMLKLIDEEQPRFPAMNPRNDERDARYRAIEFADSLAGFAADRARLLARLESLPPGAWLRTGTVTGGGPPRERTVLFYGCWLAGHERGHRRHLKRLVRSLQTARG